MIDERRTAQASRYVLGTLPAAEKHDFEAALRLDPKLGLLVQQLRGTEGGARGPGTGPGRSPGDVPVTPAPLPLGPQPSTSAVVPAGTESPKMPAWILWTPWLLTACFAVLCAVLSSSLISASRKLRHQATELAAQLQQKRLDLAELQRQNSMIERAAAERATNYQQRVRELEGSLFKGIEQLGQQNAGATNQLIQQLSATNRELAAAHAELQKLANAKKALEQALEALGTRERERFKAVRLITLRPVLGDPGGTMGAAFWSPSDQRGLLAVENLPGLPPTQGYQLWVVDTKSGAPVSAGLLPVKAGSVRVQFTADARIETLQRVFVTIESALGASAPGGATVLSGN